MASVDIKTSRGILNIIAIATCIAGAGTVFVTQQAVVAKEMSHIVAELKEIAANTKAQTITTNLHNTSLAEHNILINSIQTQLDDLKAQVASYHTH